MTSSKKEMLVAGSQERDDADVLFGCVNPWRKGGSRPISGTWGPRAISIVFLGGAELVAGGVAYQRPGRTADSESRGLATPHVGVERHVEAHGVGSQNNPRLLPIGSVRRRSYNS